MSASIPPILHISDFIADDTACHYARRTFEHGGILEDHGHDFAEVFWVESGAGVHEIDGKQETISPGWIRLVEPGDVHGIRGSWSKTLRIANIAFPITELEPLQNRFDRDTGYQALEHLRSGELVLSEHSLGTILRSAEILQSDSTTSLDLARFLTTLLSEVESHLDRRRRTAQTDLPGWLVAAQHQMEHDEALLSDGLDAMCHLAHRTADHLNRTTRKHLGVTATAFVNDLRLSHAEFLLRTTDRTITDVAFSSGFSNIGHFHSRFKRRFEMTPRTYRNRIQGTVRT